MNWDLVEKHLNEVIQEAMASKHGKPCFGQEHATWALLERIKQHGVILADEVGLGKTRVALMLMEAVMRAGGSVAAVVPAGLLFQWEKEATSFSKTLNSSKVLLKSPKKLRSYDNLFDSTQNYPICTSKNWALISHNFGFLIRQQKNTQSKRYDLFGLLRVMLWEECGWDLDRPWKKFQSIALERSARLQLAAKYLAKRIARMSESNSIRSFLQNELNNPINANGAELNNIQTHFLKEGAGEQLAFQSIGYLVGDIDLLVIDEAHKSREEVQEDQRSFHKEQKRLSILLQQILRQPKQHGRRLCLTATPVELGASQWSALLQRCGHQIDETRNEILTEFEQSLSNANSNPDNPKLLDHVIQRSKAFQSVLKNVVVRRRRINQPEHKMLLRGLPLEGAHPHRSLKSVPMDPAKLTLNWQKAILCMEGMSCAGRGSDASNQDKMLTYRYASAMMDLNEVPDETLELATDPKKRRLAFWKKLAFQHAYGSQSYDFPLLEHPRVQATADHIEQCLKASPEEKVLVFGRFTKPMQALRWELNARFVLRRMVTGQPVTMMNVDAKRLHQVFKRIAKSKNPEDGFQEKLDLWSSFSAFKDACNETTQSYLNLQSRLRNWFPDEELIDQLPGSSCFKQMLREDQERKEDHLDQVLSRFRSDLLDQLLGDGKVLSIANSFTKKYTEDKETYWKILKDICADYITGAYDQNVTQNVQEQSDLEEDGEHFEANWLGDQLTPDHLYEAMDLDSEAREGKHSAFCRLMDGEMKMATRRIVQERFNRDRAFPRVLVAQSTVGREGLNLHEACRRVVLFHPEWNPAVVEQEVGRVDRIKSLWSQKAEKWQEERCTNPSLHPDTYPRIHVDFVVFDGTYDKNQFNVLEARRKSLEAQLFGALLDEDALQKGRVPEEYLEKLKEAAPCFEPKISRRGTK